MPVTISGGLPKGRWRERMGGAANEQLLLNYSELGTSKRKQSVLAPTCRLNFDRNFPGVIFRRIRFYTTNIEIQAMDFSTNRFNVPKFRMKHGDI